MEKAFILRLPIALRGLISIFVITLSVGYFSALFFVNETTSSTPRGIVENYNGNEDNEEALEMKFKKSRHEMLNIIHTHILSMSILFFILALLVFGSAGPSFIRSFLMVEPMISVLFTFGGIYLIWLGFKWVKYIVMASGFLMTASFLASSLIILYTCTMANSSKH